ncbi:hypothetical protein CN916_20495 [Bacillus thuringiensis]|nr:hypothetical protein CN916_20495 [Bacillus thuringiensis]
MEEAEEHFIFQKKEQNKEVKQEPVKRNKDCTTNNMWFHHTMTSNVTYGSYDSDSHSSSYTSHSSYDLGSISRRATLILEASLFAFHSKRRK